MSAPIPQFEERRLSVLHALKVLDTPPDPGFEDIAAIARDLAGTPIVLITLVDAHRQWFKACIGLDIAETSRDAAFCAYAILSSEVLWVDDAAKDARFARNPLVTGSPYIRFYAGAPLIVDGHAMGSLCVIAPEPRAYDARLALQLSQLARLVADRLAERRDLTLFAGVVDRSPDGIACCDGRGVITYWNPATERIFGYPAALALGRSWKAIVPATVRPSFESAFDRLKTVSGDGTDFTVVAVRRPDGSEFRIELGLVRTGDAESSEAAVILRDCTEREQALSELEAAKNAAEASNRAKDAFLANMSHELRTPMNGVMGMLRLLARRELDSAARDCVRTAEASAARLYRLLERILAYARLENGDVPHHVEAFELAELVAEATIGSGAQDRVRAETAPGTPAALCADVGKLSQILDLLVENALRFSEGEVVITASTGMSCDGLQLELAVLDGGPGIPADQRERIFESFYQGDASDTRRRDGAGMGLPLARALARSLGGELALDAGYVHGARFVLTAPIAEARDTASSPTTEKTAVDSRPLRILVAEDHPVNEKVLVALLELFGQTAHVAHDGAQAVAAATSADYDLILMDIQMPIMDGIAATTAIRASLGVRCPPIFAVTASASPNDLQRYLNAGMAGLVPKPVLPQQLLACLEAAAAAKEESEEGQVLARG